MPNSSSSSSAASLLSFTIARLSKLFTADNLSRVNSHGYLIIDNAVPSNIAHALHSEILQCHGAGLMDSNHTAYVQPSTDSARVSIARLYPKPNIYEAELLPPLLSSDAVTIPTLTALSSSLVPFIDARFAAYYEQLLLYEGDTSVKLQVNRGSGCFPFHFDSPGGLKDTRRLTCLLYLNSDWIAGDGGELVFQPFLGHPVHVAPLFNRMVIFRSDRMLHRVNVSHVQRVCLTIWAHGRGDDSDESAINHSNSDSANGSNNNSGDYASDWLAALQRPSVQRVLSKAVYGEEWKQSYQRAHAGNDGAIALSQSIDEDVKLLMQKPGVGAVLPLLFSLVEEKKAVVYKGAGAGDVDGAELAMDEESKIDDSDDAPVAIKDVNADVLDFLSFL